MLDAHSRSRDRQSAGPWSVCLGQLALGTLLALGAGACRATPSTPVPHVTLTIGYQGDGLNSSGNGVPIMVAQLENETLVRLTPDGHPEPALADHWDRSDDDLTWKFFLRPGLTFHDGTPIDARAAAGRLQPARSTTSPTLADIVSVDAVGPLEVDIRLRRPSNFLLNIVALQTIRSPAPKNAGAGPFRAVSSDQSHATLSAFDHYYRGKPAIDEVEIRTYQGGRNSWSALMRNEIDFLYEVAPDALEFVQGSSAVQVKPFIRSYVHLLGFNLRHPMLRQRVVREALNAGIDRAQIVKEQFAGRAEVATGMLYPKHWAYDNTQPGFRYAPQEAIRMLDAAGLRVKPSSDGHMPSRFRFTCLVPTGVPRFEREALLLQRQLNELGIDMEIEPAPSNTLLKRLSTGQYEAFLYQMLQYDPEIMYTFWHSPEEGGVTMLDSGYRAADAALERVRAARTDDQTRAAVADLQKAMHDEPPAVPLCWEQITRAVNGRFRLPEVKDRDIWRTVWQWQPASDRPVPTALLIGPPR